MPQHVLRITCAELEAAEVVDDLLVQTRDVGLLGGGPADLTQDVFAPSLRFGRTTSSMRVG